MHIFLVGGAVRDQLIDYPVIEHDWVVVGETPETMLAQGFHAVGKDFPVFLHPKTRDEYALARTERKIAAGYKGFKIYSDPSVTLEADLIRRDLTINAMALSPDGKIIDPYGGQDDLKNRIFRHVSPAFSEDPVRVLRLARFAARYQHLNFTIAPETLALMQKMVAEGEISHLVAERVWTETYKALNEKNPAIFFEVLRKCNALAVIFPEIDQLFGVPQPEKYHPEIDTGIHALLSLTQASRLSTKPEVRFAALVHDLGKALTPKQLHPSHRGHEKSGLKPLNVLCQRLKVPNQVKKLAKVVMEYHTHCHRAVELKASTLVDLLATLGALKKPENLDDFLLACEADSKGRYGKEQLPYPQADYMKRALAAAIIIDTHAILQSDLQGNAIGEAIRDARIRAVKSIRKQQRLNT
ncbi:MAG: multifunctional CCA addition/repair protein [Methylococcales bacterium]|nr:multifunctional CCA addition/repair protein [Methylococcales bacterium]MCK5924275.1 multifunctional CCA addition/repair protein [Methylococcales bacterium]